MATSSPPTTGVVLSPAQIAGRIVRNGGRGDGVAIGTAIVLRESRGRSNAYRPEAPTQAVYDADPDKYNKPGKGNDRGAIQFNDKAHPEISDADAYDVDRSFAWFARKSAGFTDFGPWDVGPNAYSGVDKLARLQASEHWAPARAAAAAPDQSTPVSTDPVDPMTPEDWEVWRAMTDAERDHYMNQPMNQDPVTPAPGATTREHEAGTHWLQRAAGGVAVLDTPTPTDIVTNIVPDWAAGLTQMLRNLLSGSFWRRILIVLGGVALVTLAVVLANRGTIAAVATKGAVTSE